MDHHDLPSETDRSNTSPESPLMQITAEDLWNARRGGGSAQPTMGPALAQASTSPGAARALYEQIKHGGSPLIEDTDDADHRLITIMYESVPEISQVHVFGQLTHDSARAADAVQSSREMTRIRGTNLWGLTVRARIDLRTTYRILPCVSDPSPIDLMSGARADPFNPLTTLATPEHDQPRIIELHTPDSIIELEAAPFARPLPSTGEGSSWTRHWFRSELLGNTRRVWTWSPSTTPQGVLIVHDGYDWS